MAQCTPKSFDLTGKVALITGASYGIGMAIAKAMAANGATIVFNDLKQELVDKGLAAYAEAGIKAHGYVCNVCDEDAVNAMVAKITEEVGHINILVNNAGIIKRIPMTEMTAAEFRQVVDVDLNAPFIVSKAVIPDMIAQGGGKIINICSMMSELGRETVSAYAAAKGGLKMLTKNIASEYGEYNIQCNGIGPGYIATPQTFDLTGKVALITGASYGIGMAIAKAMAANGATIVFNDLKQELVDKGLAAYAEAGIKAHGYVCNVCDEDAVNAMVAKITEEVGHINILVNNAGIIKRIPMTEMTAAEFRQVVDVDLNAPFIVSKAVIPDMIAQGGGKIINICSMMSELGRETVSAYAAAKGGLKMLTKNIASEYGEYNIQCNGMGPGYIATAQTAPLREIQPDGSRHPFDQFITAKTPAGRWGEAEDMVGPCVFLASHASDFVNGQILYADGGILAYIGRQPK